MISTFVLQCMSHIRHTQLALNQTHSVHRVNWNESKYPVNDVFKVNEIKPAVLLLQIRTALSRTQTHTAPGNHSQLSTTVIEQQFQRNMTPTKPGSQHYLRHHLHRCWTLAGSWQKHTTYNPPANPFKWNPARCAPPNECVMCHILTN